MQRRTELWGRSSLPQYYGKRKTARFFMEGRREREQRRRGGEEERGRGGVNNDHVRESARLNFKTRAQETETANAICLSSHSVVRWGCRS